MVFLDKWVKMSVVIRRMRVVLGLVLESILREKAKLYNYKSFDFILRGVRFQDQFQQEVQFVGNIFKGDKIQQEQLLGVFCKNYCERQQYFSLGLQVAGRKKWVDLGYIQEGNYYLRWLFSYLGVEGERNGREKMSFILFG